MVVVSVVIEKKKFRIIEGHHKISDELKNKIIKTYTDEDNTKVDAAVIASKKYNVSRIECIRILKNVPNKPRYKNRSYVSQRIEENGGLDLIKAFRMERWAFGEICGYFNVDIVSLNRYIKKYEPEKLPFRDEVTDEDVDWVKRKYGIE